MVKGILYIRFMAISQVVFYWGFLVETTVLVASIFKVPYVPEILLMGDKPCYYSTERK